MAAAAASLTKPRGAKAQAQRTGGIRAHTLRPHRAPTLPQAHTGICRHVLAHRNTHCPAQPPREAHAPARLSRGASPPPPPPEVHPPEQAGAVCLADVGGGVGVGGVVGAKAVWASPGGGSRRTLRSASPLKNPPAEEADVGVARPMAAARLGRLEDVSQSERQSWFRPIDGRRARLRRRRTRCPLPAPSPGTPAPTPAPARCAALAAGHRRPPRRGPRARVPSALWSLAPCAAALPGGGPRRPQPQLAHALCSRGLPSPARSAGPPCSCCRRAARSSPSIARRSFSSCPAAATCECRGPRARWAGGGPPSPAYSAGTGRAGNRAARSLGGAPGARRARERGYFGSPCRPERPRLRNRGRGGGS